MSHELGFNIDLRADGSRWSYSSGRRFQINVPPAQNRNRLQNQTLTASGSSVCVYAINPVVVFGLGRSTTAPRRLRSAGFLFAHEKGDRAC
jgi:hypothetical protein